MQPLDTAGNKLMIRNFECPSCAAPLQYAGGPTQYCEYCQSTVIAPPELRPVRQFYQVQPNTVIDLRPYTRGQNGGISKGIKWVVGIFIFMFVLSTLAPLILGLIGVIVSMIATAAEL
jgi:hypothetical protein